MKVWMLCLLAALPVCAQDAGKSPLDELRPLIGQWSVVNYSKDANGAWAANEPTTSEVVALLDGRVLQETVTLKIGPMSFKMLVNYTYDPFRQVFRVTAVDHMSGMMDVTEGVMKDGALVLDNLRAKTFFPWGGEKKAAFRLTKKFKDKDHFDIQAEVSFDEGKTWQPYTRTEYTRK